MKKLVVLFLLLALGLYFPSTTHAAREIRVKSIKVHDAQEFLGDPLLNKTYYHASQILIYQKGKVYLSGSADGTAPISFSHGMNIYGQYPASGSFYIYPGCGQHEIPPLELTQFIHTSTDHFRVGVRYNREWCNMTKKVDDITIQYANVGDLYLVYFEENDDAPDPFLRLPWDYEKNGLDFYDVSTKINSFFDHEYPLLSATHIVQEPLESLNSIMKFDGLGRTSDAYTSHDGYDWGGRAKAFNGDPVLAAASGVATYVNSCGACGNAIHIDHGNGYQTRYYHLQKTGLITNSSIPVQQGDQIGLIGTTGESEGPHIHFMVIYDKNGDGNFDDNIPDGLVDPFGWHSYDPDPWEEFSFSQNGEERTGSQSHYLWMNPYKKLQGTVSPDGSNLLLHRYKLNFPKNAVDVDTIIEASLKPITTDESSDHFGSAIKIKIHDGYGNLITTFTKAWELVISLTNFDFTRIKPDTLSIFSKSEGDTEWQKEESIIDLESKKASTMVDHLSEFALIGEKIDAIPPVSTASISGELLRENVYSSERDVEVALYALDEPASESLGIAFILYQINDDEWTEYFDEPIVFDNVGQYSFQFYAQDNDLNAEDIKQILFEIATPPTPTPTPTSTPTNTPTPTFTPSPTLTQAPTHDGDVKGDNDHRKNVKWKRKRFKWIRWILPKFNKWFHWRINKSHR